MVHAPIEGQINLDQPIPKSVLVLMPELRFYSAYWPNPWWRFWCWFLLGWKWKRL